MIRLLRQLDEQKSRSRPPSTRLPTTVRDLRLLSLAVTVTPRATQDTADGPPGPQEQANPGPGAWIDAACSGAEV
jgi:hypothetical protein